MYPRIRTRAFLEKTRGCKIVLQDMKILRENLLPLLGSIFSGCVCLTCLAFSYKMPEVLIPAGIFAFSGYSLFIVIYTMNAVYEQYRQGIVG